MTSGSLGSLSNGTTIFVTFLWGNWPDEGWGPTYVNALFSGILQHYGPDCVLILGADTKNAENCRSHCDERIIIQEIDSPSWTGCLPKLNAYNPDFITARGNPVLVFDLDSIIVGSLEPFVKAVGDGLITRAWFKGIPKGIWLSGGDLLGFRAGWGHWLWEDFVKHTDWVENTVSGGGRERYIYRELLGNSLRYWQHEVPNRYFSYKNHIRGTGGKLPKTASIISCHGNPRPHEINEEWVKKYWKQ